MPCMKVSSPQGMVGASPSREANRVEHEWGEPQPVLLITLVLAVNKAGELEARSKPYNLANSTNVVDVIGL